MRQQDQKKTKPNPRTPFQSIALHSLQNITNQVAKNGAEERAFMLQSTSVDVGQVD